MVDGDFQTKKLEKVKGWDGGALYLFKDEVILSIQPDSPMAGFWTLKYYIKNDNFPSERVFATFERAERAALAQMAKMPVEYPPPVGPLKEVD